MKRIIEWLALGALLLTGAAHAQVPISYPITTQNLAATADCTVGSCVVIDMQSKGGASVEIRGTYTASGGLSLQRTNSGVWETVSSNAFIPVGGTGTATITSAAVGTWQIGGCVGFRYCRVTALGAVTGTATATIYSTIASVGGSTSVSGGAGDASASNQVTGNNSLASIDGKLPALSGGRVPMVDLTAVAQGSTTSGQSGTLIQGAVTTGAPTYTTAQTAPLSLDTSGNLRVSVAGGGSAVAGGVAHDAVGTSTNPLLMGGYASAAAPTDVSADGDAVRAWMLRSGAQVVTPAFGGTLATGGAGAVSAGTMRVTQASDSPLVAATGAQTDGAAGSDTATASLIGLTKRVAQNLTTVNTSINTAANYEATKDSAVPTRLVAMGARTGANADAVAQGATTVPINVSSATTTQIVGLSGGAKIYVTGLAVIAGGTGNITFVYGTGTNCGTGTTPLSGAFPLIANSGLTLGSGLGAVLMVPAGQALCVTTSAAVQMSGMVTYAQY
jgi:hypothetical protein